MKALILFLIFVPCLIAQDINADNISLKQLQLLLLQNSLTIINNSGNINQSGTSNTVIVNQFNSYPDFNPNIAEINQLGTLNNTSLQQTGVGNSSTINQDGNSNNVGLTVLGNYNHIDVNQLGDNNNYISQFIGVNNTDLTIEQTGTDNAIMQTQDMPLQMPMTIRQFGNRMRLIISNGNLLNASTK